MIDHLELHTVPDAANPPRAGIEHDVIGVEGEAEAGEGVAERLSHRASGFKAQEINPSECAAQI